MSPHSDSMIERGGSGRGAGGAACESSNSRRRRGDAARRSRNQREKTRIQRGDAEARRRTRGGKTRREGAPALGWLVRLPEGSARRRRRTLRKRKLRKIFQRKRETNGLALRRKARNTRRVRRVSRHVFLRVERGESGEGVDENSSRPATNWHFRSADERR